MLLDLRNASGGTNWGNQNQKSEPLSESRRYCILFKVPGGVGYSTDLKSHRTRKPWAKSRSQDMFPKEGTGSGGAGGRWLLWTDEYRDLHGTAGGCTVSQGNICVLHTGEFFPWGGGVLVVQMLQLCPHVLISYVTWLWFVPVLLRVGKWNSNETAHCMADSRQSYFLATGSDCPKQQDKHEAWFFHHQILQGHKVSWSWVTVCLRFPPHTQSITHLTRQHFCILWEGTPWPVALLKYCFHAECCLPKKQQNPNQILPTVGWKFVEGGLVLVLIPPEDVTQKFVVETICEPLLFLLK